MTKIMTRSLIKDKIQDVYGRRLYLADRAVDLNAGAVVIILDHCPELGPECLYVQIVQQDGPAMNYWVEPCALVKIPRRAA